MTKPGNLPIRLLAESLTIVAVAASCIVSLQQWLVPQLHGWLVGMVDAAALVLCAAPPLYWRAMDAMRRAATPFRPRPGLGGATLGPQQRRRRAIGMATAAYFTGLILTAAAVSYLKVRIDADAHQQFDQQVERLRIEILRRFERPVFGLNGARGVYAAAPTMNRTQFRAYVESRSLGMEFPGVQGFGFVQRVLREDLDTFVAGERRDGAPDFAVRSTGAASDLYVVKYIEPLPPNYLARGFDLGSEPVRREAIERAVSTGEATLSNDLVLGFGDRKAPGFLSVVPIYRQGADPVTPRQRQTVLVGLVYAAIFADDLLRNVLRAADSDLEFELVHGKRAETEATSGVGGAPAQAAPPPGLHPREPLFATQRTMTTGGRELTMRVRTSPEFEQMIDRSPLAIVGVGGAGLSLLLALVVWALASGRLRAQTLAERMTAELDRLAQVVKHTSNAVLITDRARRITWVNEGFTRISGYGIEAARGKTPIELLATDGEDSETLRQVALAVAEGKACRVEFLNRASDGREYWIDTELQPLRDASGALTGFMEIGSDVTEKRRASAALEAASRDLARERQRLDDIIRGTNAGTWEWNARTGVMIVNERWAGMLGRTRDELWPFTHEVWRSLVHPDDWGPTEEAMRRHLAGETDQRDCELRMAHKSGEWVWVLTKGRIATRSADGRPEWVVGTHMDITESKRADEALRRNVTMLHAILDNLPCGLSVFDGNLRLQAHNAQFRSLLDLSDELFDDGNADFERIIRHNAQRGEYGAGDVDAMVARIVERARHPVAHHLERVRGKDISLDIRGVPMPGGGFITTYTDISERKHVEAQVIEARDLAEKANAAKSQFLANMSHEIRTPMNAILGMLKLLHLTELSARQLDYADKTERAARALLGLLNDILDFSKVEAGKMSLDPHPFQLDRLLCDLSVILSANLGAKKVEVLFDVDPAVPPTLIGDALRLQQILLNLTGNALKFTSQGEVVVAVRVVHRTAAAGTLEFSVRDTGIGIAPEQQQYVFSGFSQAEASTTRRFGGTGLGLSISQRLVAMMGGEIQLESELGRGSTFSFRLEFPVAPEAETSIPAAPGEQRALVVDDNATARIVIAAMLESLGWSVELAASGSEGLAMLARHELDGTPFGAVFVDWEMPGMDGWETSRRIRAQAGHPALLLLMVTAHDRESLAARPHAERALLDGFVVKPVTASMLQDAMLHAGTSDGAVGLAGQPAATPQRRLEGLRLLLVEDNAYNRQVAQELLEAEGVTVTLASDGEQGVAAVATADPQFDVVLMDVQMPVMDGYVATAHIRQQLGLTELPIIAMTANAMVSDREASLAAGMNHHVGKPFDLDDLVSVLQPYAPRAMASDRGITAQRTVGDALPEALLAKATACGIDLAASVNRLGGRVDIWMRTAASFAADLSGSADQFETLERNGAREDAARLAHTLRGLGATLGAMRLAEVAAAIEKSVVAIDATVMSETLREVIKQTRVAIAAIVELWKETRGPAAATAGQRDAAELHAQLKPLAELLRESDMAATDRFADLVDAQDSTWQEELKPLAAAIARLDFGAALQECEQLVRTLEVE
jgi:PAS domain S-box-containing protein